MVRRFQPGNSRCVLGPSASQRSPDQRPRLFTVRDSGDHVIDVGGELLPCRLDRRRALVGAIGSDHALRERTEGPMDVVVVGYDGTETAAIAVGEGARIAQAFGSAFHLVHVVDDDGVRQGMISGHEQERREQIASQMNDEILASDREGIALALSELIVVNEVQRGPAATCLSDYATSVNADLIVMGNRRIKGLARVLGSVTIDVLRQAPCSVYVANTTS